MSIILKVKWSGSIYEIEVNPSITVYEFKNIIKDKTGVLPERQKLLNLKHRGKPASDDIKISELHLKPKMTIMMMGTREEHLEEVMGPPPDVGVVIDDFDIGEDAEVDLKDREEHLAKVQRRVKDYEVKKLNEPRPGKKLLVLDVDYTLFDHKSNAERADELMRPYLHEFLTEAYKNYDIVIWSATSMRWIEVKMRELGVTTNDKYNIAFFMDHGAMITVHTPTYGVVDTKPLGVIWGKYTDLYSPKNTIMFDDLRRNFLMNPQSGLKIRPFKNAHLNRVSDVELKQLSRYLAAIAELDDFTSLDHRRWEKFLHKRER